MKQYRATILTRMFERKALSTSMHIPPVMLRKSISPRAYSVALGRSSRNRTRCARCNETVSSETEYNKNRLRFGKRRTTKKWHSGKPRLDRLIACTLAAKRDETNARQQWSWSNENNEISVISCVCSASGFRSFSLSNDLPPVYSLNTNYDKHSSGKGRVWRYEDFSARDIRCSPSWMASVHDHS